MVLQNVGAFLPDYTASHPSREFFSHHRENLKADIIKLANREERRLRVSDNRLLRGLFGPKRDEVTRECRKLHNQELNDMYSSQNIIRVIKSRRMRWAGHVVQGKDRCIQGFGGET